MRMAVVAAGERGGVLAPLGEDGEAAGPVEEVADLVAAVAEREVEHPRWVWGATSRIYPRLLAAGVRVARCHDLELTETLLLGYEGRFGEPRSVRAAMARLAGEPVPLDVVTSQAQATLFETGDSDEGVGVVKDVHAAQIRRIAATEHADRFRLMVAAESAGGLAAVEMGYDGLPWRAEVHDGLLTEMLGPRPTGGLRPRRLQELADRFGAVLGSAANPDSPAQLVRAFTSVGVTLSSTRSHVLQEVDHPAAAVLLEYRELARLYVAHGWSWLDSWVRDGRFHPEYVAGGVVSGRWATRGGGALQIPKVLRRAVVADPGWVLVVADAAQLEPRVLGALSHDRAFVTAAASDDLYTALADAFGGVRDRAKIALLSAMYGGASGDAPQLLAVLRERFPDAYDYVEAAARAGEAGKLVRSRLGRTCPPPSAAWRELSVTDRGASAVRSRGRFTRNFVVQASAADWALALLAALRRRLALLDGPRLVFFQHDEVMVHAPADQASAVVEAIGGASQEAKRLVFGDTPVRFPLQAVTVDCYADAK